MTLDLCEGFAQGVNAWLLEHPARAPEWAEGVHPADILALLHRYLISQAPFDYPEASHLLPGTPSANAWAVAPSIEKPFRCATIPITVMVQEPSAAAIMSVGEKDSPLPSLSLGASVDTVAPEGRCFTSQ